MALVNGDQQTPAGAAEVLNTLLYSGAPASDPGAPPGAIGPAVPNAPKAWRRMCLTMGRTLARRLRTCHGHRARIRRVGR